MKKCLFVICVVLSVLLPGGAFCMESVTLTDMRFEKDQKLPSDTNIVLRGTIRDKRTKILAIDYRTDGSSKRVYADIDAALNFSAVVGPFKEDSIVFFDLYMYTYLDFQEVNEIKREIHNFFTYIKTNFALRHDEVYLNEQFAFQVKGALSKLERQNLYLSKEKKLYDEVLDRIKIYSGLLIKYGYASEKRLLIESKLKERKQEIIQYNDDFFVHVLPADTPLKAEYNKMKKDLSKIPDMKTLNFKLSYFLNRVLSLQKVLSKLTNQFTNETIFTDSYFSNMKSYKDEFDAIVTEHEYFSKIIVRVEDLRNELVNISEKSYSLVHVNSHAEVRGKKEVASFSLNYIFAPKLEDFGSFITLNIHPERALSEISSMPFYSIRRFSLSIGRSIEAFGDGDNYVRQPVYYAGLTYNINEYFNLQAGGLLYENDATENQMRTKFAAGIGVDFRIIGEVLRKISVAY